MKETLQTNAQLREMLSEQSTKTAREKQENERMINQTYKLQQMNEKLEQKMIELQTKKDTQQNESQTADCEMQRKLTTCQKKLEQTQLGMTAKNQEIRTLTEKLQRKSTEYKQKCDKQKELQTQNGRLKQQLKETLKQIAEFKIHKKFDASTNVNVTEIEKTQQIESDSVKEQCQQLNTIIKQDNFTLSQNNTRTKKKRHKKVAKREQKKQEGNIVPIQLYTGMIVQAFLKKNQSDTQSDKPKQVIAKITNHGTTDVKHGFNWTVLEPSIHAKHILNPSNYEINLNFTLLKYLPCVGDSYIHESIRLDYDIKHGFYHFFASKFIEKGTLLMYLQYPTLPIDVDFTAPGFYEFYSKFYPTYMQTFAVNNPPEFYDSFFKIHPFLMYMQSNSDGTNTDRTDCTVFRVTWAVKNQNETSDEIIGNVMVFAMRDIKINERLTDDRFIWDIIDCLNSLQMIESQHIGIRHQKITEFKRTYSFMFELAEKHQILPKIGKLSTNNVQSLIELFENFGNYQLFMQKDRYELYPTNIPNLLSHVNIASRE